MKKLLVGLAVMLSLGASAQVKIGFVDAQRLLDTMPSRKVAAEKYMAQEKEAYEELQALDNELSKMLADYEAKRADMSPVLRESAERKITDKQKALQEREQLVTQELQAYSNELNAPILKKVQDAVKIVSERKKLSMVVDKSTTLYYSPEFDITNEVGVEVMKLEKL